MTKRTNTDATAFTAAIHITDTVRQLQQLLVLVDFADQTAQAELTAALNVVESAGIRLIYDQGLRTGNIPPPTIILEAQDL